MTASQKRADSCDTEGLRWDREELLRLWGGSEVTALYFTQQALCKRFMGNNLGLMHAVRGGRITWHGQLETAAHHGFEVEGK